MFWVVNKVSLKYGCKVLIDNPVNIGPGYGLVPTGTKP